jgi:hypothetical protein
MAKAKLGSGARFKALTTKIEKTGKSEDSAKAIVASVGRKKLGKTKFQNLAEKGKKK